jgi:hypothetical protein
MPNEDVKVMVVPWFWQQLKEVSAEGFHWLVYEWDACLKCPQTLTGSLSYIEYPLNGFHLKC